MPGGGSVISVEAFNFLEVLYLDFTFFWIRYFSGSLVLVVPVDVCQLGYPRVVPFGAALGCLDVPYGVVPKCSMTTSWHL